MNTARTVLAQLLAIVPYAHFEHLVDSYQANRWTRGFTAWSHLICMVYAQLTRRERALLDALSKGLSNKDLARDFEISANTVKFHLSNLFEKLGVKNRAQAIAFYYSSRLPQETQGRR